jgi:hypothetical protein
MIESEESTQFTTTLQQETTPCELDEISDSLKSWIPTTTSCYLDYLQTISAFTTPCYLDQLSPSISITTPCFLDEITPQSTPTCYLDNLSNTLMTTTPCYLDQFSILPTPFSPSPITFISTNFDTQTTTTTITEKANIANFLSSIHIGSILFEILRSNNKRIVVISVTKNKKSKITLIRSSMNQTSLVVVNFLENPEVYVRNFNSTYPIECIKRMSPKTFITLRASTKPSIKVISNPSRNMFLVQTESKFGASSTLFRQSKILTVLFLPIEGSNLSYFVKKGTAQSKTVDDRDDTIVALSNSIPKNLFSIECS